MRLFLRIVWLGLVFAVPAGAEDITLDNGTVYQGATILHHDAATATILYDDGGAAVSIAQLPADIQKRLDYDPAAAQKQLAADAAANARQHALAARTQLLEESALKVWGEVLHVRPDGFVADLKTVDKCVPPQPITRTTPVQTLPVGLSSPDVFQTTVVGYRRVQIALSHVFIETDVTGLVDRSHWRGIVWPIGTYSYVTDEGRHMTIAAYTVSPDRAYNTLASNPQPSP